MTAENKKKIISNDYIDLFIEPDIDNQRHAESVNGIINSINNRYSVIHIPIDKAKENPTDSRYPALPRLFGLVNESNLETMGVIKIQNIPSFALRGQGVLLGFIDTGIQYMNPLFQYEDKTTRILSIWDQTIENIQASEEIFNYGMEYTSDQINLALLNENPLSIVPTNDNDGHGTRLAGLSGGLVNDQFRGIATLAEYVIVKLKPAKKAMDHFYPIPENIKCYQENDIMFGIEYLYKIARRLNRPMAICIALGTNQGSHDGLNPLSLMVSDYASRKGIAIVIAAGNENMAGHHFHGKVERQESSDEYKKTVTLNVAEHEKNFIMEIWGKAPDIYSIGIHSPSGDEITRIPPSLQKSTRYFIFENTTVVIEYYNIEPNTGDQLILIYFNNPAQGRWSFNIYAKAYSNFGFHVWLPMSGFLKERTQLADFMELTELSEKTPETTLTSPGDSSMAITVTAYDHHNGNIYNKASRGYTRDNRIKPEFAAPGVSIYCPTLDNKYELRTGTSLAAAQTTGIAAMILEWGIVKLNSPSMNGLEVKQLIILGTKKKENIDYPNPEWGYGIVDIFESFKHPR